MRRAAPSAPTWKSGSSSRPLPRRRAGDLVIGLEHHGLVPHFDVQPTILPMYLVNGYERIAQEYADAGMSVVFTGHMHAVDIAAMTTAAGNTFYDIETGSALTYPCPVRFVDLRRSTVGGETNTYMSVSTKTHIGPIHYTDPATGRCVCDRRPDRVCPGIRLHDRYAQDGRG